MMVDVQITDLASRCQAIPVDGTIPENSLILLPEIPFDGGIDERAPEGVDDDDWIIIADLGEEVSHHQPRFVNAVGLEWTEQVASDPSQGEQSE